MRPSMTTTNQVSEAADRLRRYHFGVCISEDARHDRLSDSEDVAMAYLAELDPSEIDEKVFAELGFLPSVMDGAWVNRGSTIDIRAVNKGGEMRWLITAGWLAMAGVRTAGQLRTLIRLSRQSSTTSTSTREVGNE